jgi:hypothetical protein
MNLNDNIIVFEYDSLFDTKRIIKKCNSQKELQKLLRKKYNHRSDNNGDNYVEIIQGNVVINKFYIS